MDSNPYQNSSPYTFLFMVSSLIFSPLFFLARDVTCFEKQASSMLGVTRHQKVCG